MSKHSRDYILGRLKGASKVDRGDASIGLPEAKLEPQWLDIHCLTQHLSETLEGLTVVSRPFNTQEQLRQILDEIARENSVRSCVAWDHPLLGKLGVPKIFKDLDMEYRCSFKDEYDFRQYCAQADLGLTATDAIIDESGTVVVRAKRGWERSTSLLPPIHVVILEASKILPSVSRIPQLLRSFLDEGGSLPSAVHFITGPSRTADIEFNLVLGVHGPKKVYLLVAGDTPSRLA